MESNGYLMIVETLTRFSFNIVCKRYDFFGTQDDLEEQCLSLAQCSSQHLQYFKMGKNNKTTYLK